MLRAVITIQGQVRAIIIGERLNRETLLIHIQKAQPEFDQLYQYIDNEVLRREKESYSYVNMEQDLVEGLPKAKQSYYPICFEKKYTVKIKGN